MGIPYPAIGIGLAFLFGIWAFIVADSLRGRGLIAAAMATIFFLPVVWKSATAQLISFIAWLIFALGCYVFLKCRGVGVP